MSRHTPRPQRLASLQDAASYADLSVRTIRRYIATGRITGYRVGPHLIKVDLDDFDKLAVPIPTVNGGRS